MDKITVVKIVDRFHEAIKTRGIRPNKIILYGSWASGKAREYSDIDIVIVSDDFSDKDYWERIDILSDVIYELFEPIEAVAMTQQEWDRGDSFISDYARDGEVLFAA